MPSKNTRTKEYADSLEADRRKAFIAALQELEKQHGYRVLALLRYSATGMYSELAVDKLSETKDESVA